MSPSQAHLILTKLCVAETFRAFIIRLENGRDIQVQAHHRLALPSNPSAGTFAVYVGEDFSLVSLDAIVSIDF